MSTVENMKEVFLGLGRVDLSEKVIPAFDKNKVCVSVSRVVLASLVGLLAIATLITACVCCATGGVSLFCGLITIIFALVGVAWSILMFKRFFAERIDGDASSSSKASKS
ncbi:hypothetical protein O1W69_05300 [Chlamydia sp. 12-01]|uniref:hypothetical protein n=1 Tax=Chlamydia sp. 12-01 TaxID=3002742 RepID=UPI0035D3EC6C